MGTIFLKYGDFAICALELHYKALTITKGLERYSFEHCKAKTKVITTPSENKGTYQKKPTRQKPCGAGRAKPDQVAIGFSSASDWLRDWESFLDQSKSIVKQDRCYPGLLSIDTQLRIALGLCIYHRNINDVDRQMSPLTLNV